MDHIYIYTEKRVKFIKYFRRNFTKKIIQMCEQAKSIITHIIIRKMFNFFNYLN